MRLLCQVLALGAGCYIVALSFGCCMLDLVHDGVTCLLYFGGVFCWRCAVVVMHWGCHMSALHFGCHTLALVHVGVACWLLNDGVALLFFKLWPLSGLALGSFATDRTEDVTRDA